jgi:hypothetical protein
MPIVIVLFLLTSMIPVAGQRRSMGTDTLQLALSMIQAHPDQQFRSDMTTWYKSGRYLIDVVPELPGDLGSEYQCLADDPKSCWPVLLISSQFFASTSLEPITPPEKEAQAIRLEKYAALYHEYIHLKNHFAGKYPLNSGINKKPVEEQAAYHWGTEWDAFTGQWQFLKRMGAEYVFFNSPSAALGEAAFLEKFYKNLQKYPHFGKLRPYFEQRYREQKKLLP